MPYPIRALLIGDPGTGKTGGLAPLVDAGYSVRALMFDKVANIQPLFGYSAPEGHSRISVFACEDAIVGTAATPMTVKTPRAYSNALAQLNDWKEADSDGAIRSLGNAADWGPDTILLVDSITALGEAAMRRTLGLMSRTVFNRRIQDWGTAAAEQQAFIELITSGAMKCHVVVTSHLKMIGPKTVEKDDDETTKSVKAAQAEVVPTRLYPSALGQGLPRTVAQFFPTVLLFENKFVGERPVRIIRTVPRPEIDVKVAAKLPAELPLETGMLTVFEALSGKLVRGA